MSGTSLDGLDIVFAQFKLNNGIWSHQISHCKTSSYSKSLENRLRNATQSTALEISLLNIDLAKHFAEEVNAFILENKIPKKDIHCIASHGHTVFHQPDRGMTLQIGCGQTLASYTNIRVINNFREKDVVLGGQGAPLVPIGDALLLDNIAEAYLNLGGFANISIPKKNMLAFDLCPANLALNTIAKEMGLDFDKDGELGKSSPIDSVLLKQLNQLEYYAIAAPKSLGTEWLEDNFLSLLAGYNFSQKLGTVYEHIATIISSELNHQKVNSVMITGGGAKNSFLIAKIKEKYSGNIILPETQMIDFKEALIFAFLGVLKLRNEVNCLAAVTGAKRDNVGGNIYLP